MEFTDSQRSFMTEALRIAQKVKGKTFPNPAVGALVVAGGEIVGRGATSPWGGPHAEKIALAQAGKRAKNAALYVTLEPCCHFGRTPPCTDSIVSSGIKTVFFPIKDPNPLVNGRGIHELKKKGITVVSGLLSEEAKAINEDFFWSVTRKIPWITLKLAMTLDGRIADERGYSQWITSARSRRFVHDLRRRHAAILVGGATVLRDNPRLSVRCGPSANPARIVFSSSPHLPARSYFIKNVQKTRSIVVLGGGKSASMEKSSNGLELWHTGSRTREINLASFLKMAYKEGLTSILVEGGSATASLFMEAQCVNKVYFFYGNKVLGSGLNGLSFFNGLPLSRAIELRKRMVRVFGDDIMISGYPIGKNARDR
jgi:diaminohydroxyphosphoribosylaminopyrimidine deaminase / 5-amino-6-(5-phosphoribosylamino)uracil reductase